MENGYVQFTFVPGTLTINLAQEQSPRSVLISFPRIKELTAAQHDAIFGHNHMGPSTPQQRTLRAQELERLRGLANLRVIQRALNGYRSSHEVAIRHNGASIDDIMAQYEPILKALGFTGTEEQPGSEHALEETLGGERRYVYQNGQGRMRVTFRPDGESIWAQFEAL